ncbi:unnamed protein product [Mucor circinelloides]|uniref:Uncharacterized protein n=1 Tax=Mucor circinelloides f. circinelloides (strain 1006PhL) TaxID=1220926 RepID=S2K1D0_MUCC1|nr:hypothetical protein HMPREF1544_07292 [Mucor circinelloides 1006PhL]KAG1110654.1 hypothetical protein G6F42_015264 [Rhizopus arrhizus]
MQKPTSHKSKAVQFMELREQLMHLEHNLVVLQENMDITTKQIPSIRKLTTLHSAMFMSAGTVLNPSTPENTSK